MSTADASDGVSPSPAKRPRKGFQASKGLYFKHVELPRDADGKRRRRTFYGSSPAAVDRKIADAKARGGGSIVPANPTRLAEYAERWLEQAGLPGPDGRGLKPTTVETCTWVWGQVAPIVGGVRLDKCDGEMARLVVAELQRRPRTRIVAGKSVERTATANTVRHVTRVMHTLFKDATDDRVFFGINPFAQLGRRGKPKHKPKKGRALTLDEGTFSEARLKLPLVRNGPIASVCHLTYN
jgi:hypothetical protein